MLLEQAQGAPGSDTGHVAVAGFHVNTLNQLRAKDLAARRLNPLD